MAFAREESVVIGRADADVDRTPRNEPVKCTCCALHVVGYAFECLACAGERADGDARARVDCARCAFQRTRSYTRVRRRRWRMD